MTSQIVNVGPIMRTNSFIQISKRKTEKIRVSPEAVQEYIKRIQDHIEINMPLICEITRSHKRNTVFADDITEFFSYKKNSVAGKGDHE